MDSTLRERKKEKNRKDLMECAVSLFKEKGFTATTIEEILEKATISRGTLYNYFPDKESILVSYFQNRIAEGGQQLQNQLATDNGIREQLGSLLDFMYEVLADDFDLAGVYFKYRLRGVENPFETSRRSGMESLLAEVIQAAQARGELRADFPAAFVARNFQFLAMSFLLTDLPDGKPDFNSLNKAQVVEFFLNGAGAK